MSNASKICYFCGRNRIAYAWVRISILQNKTHRGYPCCNSCGYKAENVLDNMTELSKRISDLENELEQIKEKKS